MQPEDAPHYDRRIKNRAEVRRERKSEISSALLNAQLNLIPKGSKKLYFSCRKMFFSGKKLFIEIPPGGNSRLPEARIRAILASLPISS
jgi:hypothetical protein